jgi:glycosyltransferase involved in cell wall biosynthesis
MVEAMTMGVPVVAWDYGGAKESLGLLFPRGLVTPHDMDALVVTVEDVLSRRLKPLRNERFLTETMTRETIALYRELLKPADAG